MPDEILPSDVLASVLGQPGTLVDLTTEPVSGGSGAATAAVTRLSGHARAGGRRHAFTLIRKEFAPVRTGRHAPHAMREDHWAYWRREPLAYASGLLPKPPGLTAPSCHGVLDDTIYLQDVDGPPEDSRTATTRLARWQRDAGRPDVGWLAGHQLAQRIAASDLNWHEVEADPRLADAWGRRHEILRALEEVPVVLSHGDFHTGNLVAAGASTIALDWGTFGVAPAGADAAHLALSTLDDCLPAYVSAFGPAVAPEAIALGYRATLVLTGASRIHWMLSRGLSVPDAYLSFVLSHARRLD